MTNIQTKYVSLHLSVFDQPFKSQQMKCIIIIAVFICNTNYNESVRGCGPAQTLPFHHETEMLARSFWQNNGSLQIIISQLIRSQNIEQEMLKTNTIISVFWIHQELWSCSGNFVFQ